MPNCPAVFSWPFFFFLRTKEKGNARNKEVATGDPNGCPIALQYSVGPCFWVFFGDLLTRKKGDNWGPNWVPNCPAVLSWPFFFFGFFFFFWGGLRTRKKRKKANWGPNWVPNCPAAPRWPLPCVFFLTTKKNPKKKTEGTIRNKEGTTGDLIGCPIALQYSVGPFFLVFFFSGQKKKETKK